MERLDRPRWDAARLWRNPPVRRLTWLLGAAALAAALLLWLYVDQSGKRLEQDWLEQQSAILGRLSTEHPDSVREWARLLAHPGNWSSADVDAGRKLAEQYGLTPDLGAQLSPVLSDYRTRAALALGAGLLALFGALAILLLREYRRQLGEIRSLAVSLENAVKHLAPMAYRLYGEGEIGLLASSVQELAIRLQETIGQLRREKEFLKDTVADISHQLKTPLASLAIYTDLLLEGQVDPATAREFLTTCRRELDRMEWLIQTLLTIARMEADALPLHIHPASIPQTVQRACDAVRRLTEERGVALAAEFPPPEEAIIPHDARWLGEAVVNLLKNAVEHSPPGSEVRIRCERTPVFFRLLVEDQGGGIEENHLPHIFKKFYRKGSGGSGVGLGLPLAKSIVERHGGMLSAAIRPEGGSRFTVALPLHPLPGAEIFKSYDSVSSDSSEL